MPPSLSAYFSFGNFCTGTFDHTKSAAACTMLIGDSVMSTSIGASSAVITIFDDDPMCTLTTVPSSSHVAKNLSQWPEWMLGIAEVHRVLRERHREAALVGDAPHLGGHLVDVPHHRDRRAG